MVRSCVHNSTTKANTQIARYKWVFIIFLKRLITNWFFLVPGKGTPCGSDTCNRYANCHFDFGIQKFSCRCVPGFKGDGYQTCERASGLNPLLVMLLCFDLYLNSQHFLDVQDCRQRQNCHRDATCDFDPEEGIYLCLCNEGYIGNGIVCRPAQGMS
jgi:hypothetical protein